VQCFNSLHERSCSGSASRDVHLPAGTVHAKVQAGPMRSVLQLGSLSSYVAAALSSPLHHTLTLPASVDQLHSFGATSHRRVSHLTMSGVSSDPPASPHFHCKTLTLADCVGHLQVCLRSTAQSHHITKSTRSSLFRRNTAFLTTVFVGAFAFEMYVGLLPTLIQRASG
jgi:hypothetical protein